MLQFIGRLRFVMKDLPEDAIRESYIFIQKSMGSTADFAKVNREFEFMREALCKEFAIREDDINTQDTASLSQTLARVMTERFQTWSDHVNQWEQAGKTFE